MINPHSHFDFENIDSEIFWTVPAELPYFDGHFPENPILPGVALLDLIQVILGKNFKSIRSAKFTELVRPGDQLNIHKTYDPTADTWSLQIFNQTGASVCKASVSLA